MKSVFWWKHLSTVLYDKLDYQKGSYIWWVCFNPVEKCQFDYDKGYKCDEHVSTPI